MTDTTPEIGDVVFVAAVMTRNGLQLRHPNGGTWPGTAWQPGGLVLAPVVPSLLALAQAQADGELATLRRELAEARERNASAYDRGCATAAEELVTLRRERDEAVAETARVRTVYRDALARWRDELTQLRKAVTTIAARRERERPDDIIVDALRAALDGAATPTEDARS